MEITGTGIVAQRVNAGSLREWSTFLSTLNNTKTGGRPLIRHGVQPERLAIHLESRLAGVGSISSLCVPVDQAGAV